MNNKAIELAKLTVLAIGAALSISNAQAGPLITNWNFVTEDGFSSFAPAAAVTPSLNNTTLVLPTKLSWGSPLSVAGQSSFSIVGNVPAEPGRLTGSLVTNGPEVLGSQIVHENFVVDVPLLTDATLKVQAVLTPTAPPGPDVGPFNLSFDIHFLETLNAPTCVVTSPTPCNDIFVVDVTGAGFDLATLSFLVPVGPLDGNNYTVGIRLAGVGPLTDAACSAVGRAAGCVGFTTVEEQTNTFQAFVSIIGRETPVPEPGMLSLFAAGLIGMRQLRRKQAVA